MTEKYEVVRAMLHGFDYEEYLKANASRKVALIPEAMEHILATDP